MLKDNNGLSVSTDLPAAIDALTLFSDQLLRLGKGVDKIILSASEFPDCALIQAYAAALHLYDQTREGLEKANAYLSAIKEPINPRELSFIQALRFWQKNQISNALYHFVEHCMTWPKDVVAIKIMEFLFYCKGQKFEAPLFLDVAQTCAPHHLENPLFLSILSFAQELNGLYDESKITAEKALELDEDNPWAHHTLAHYYLNKGLIDQGLKITELFSLSWPKFGRPIQSHNLWHLALFYLENLDYQGVLNVYQRANWSKQAELVLVEIDAAALLWRLDFEGASDEALWQELADKIGNHANFATTPFVSVHLIYTLQRGKKEEAAKEALSRTKEFVKGLEGEDRAVWKKVGLPLIEGAWAFANRDYKTALKHFDPMIYQVGAAGGSDAQIDLFHQTYLKSLIGGQRYSDAKSFLEKLTKIRKPTSLERKWMGECLIS